MSDNPRVIVYGLGPIGCGIVCLILEHPYLQLIGGVDIDPQKYGRDIGEVVGLERSLGIKVEDKLNKILSREPANLVLHTTNSYLDLIKPQILEILDAGLDIVSTSEELSFPYLAHPTEAIEIDIAAKKVGKTVLATGINPGFIMDSLPLFFTAICHNVDHIEVRRVQNASKRRGPFQSKIGSGLTVEEFRMRMESGRMGHVGLPESAGMLLDSLGKKMIRFEDHVEPIIAKKNINTAFFKVPKGRIIGLQQVARAFTEEGEFLSLVFIAALDNEEDQDTIIIKGKPNLTVTIQGANGDLATVAIAVNAIRRVLFAQPGLLTMRDIPLVTMS